MFRGSGKGTGYPLHSPVSPSLPLPRITVCLHISTGLYHFMARDVIENYLSEIHRPLIHMQPAQLPLTVQGCHGTAFGLTMAVIIRLMFIIMGLSLGSNV